MADDDALISSTDSLGPWTIKVMPKSIRDMTVAAARDEGLTVGQWLERVIRERVAEGRPSPQPVGASSLTPTELAGLMQGMAALATATGTPPAKADMRRAYALVDDQVRQARGMPPRPIRQPKAKAQAQLEGPSPAEGAG